MKKDKFDRNKPRRNIEEIGGGNITHSEYAIAMELFQHFEEESNKRREQLLSDLISKYGQEAGYEKYKEITEDNNSIYDNDRKRKSKK